MEDRFEFLDVIDATFQPQRVDTLKPGVAAWIGWRGLWQQQGECPPGPYEGQLSWGFAPEAYCELADRGVYPPFCWVPQCDLMIHKRVAV